MVASTVTDLWGVVEVVLGAKVKTYFVKAGNPESPGRFVQIYPHQIKEIHLKV